jgi:hypothetical protein
VAERDYRYRIGATDDASQVLAKVAGAAKREMRKVDEALEGSASAGKRMADALSAMAEEIDGELSSTAAAADRLGEALGPELRAKIGDAGLDKFVGDLRSAGLTFDDIEQDADELAASLAKIADTSDKAGARMRQSLDDTSDATRRMGDQADRTGSVAANAYGNMAQDLGAVTGVAGSAGVALGQLAEYAAEGGIKLATLAKMAGPVLLAGVAIQQLAGHMQDIAKVKAFNSDQVKDWVERIREGRTAAEAMVEAFSEAGKVELGLGNFGEIGDFTSALSQAGVSVEMLGRLAEGTDEQVEAWRQRMVAAGVDAEALEGVLAAVALSKGQLQAATAAAEATEGVFGRTIRDVNEQLAANRQRNDEARAAIEGRTSAMLEGIGGDIAYRESVRQSNEALAAYNEVVNSGTASADELGAAQDNAAQAVLDVATAAADSAADLEEMAGTEQTAGERATIMRDELQRVADTLAPGSPLRVQLEGYIGQLNRVPRTVSTRLNVQYAEGSLPLPSAGGGRGPQGFAKGGRPPVGKVSIVGEEGPEPFVPDTAGTILPSDHLTIGPTSDPRQMDRVAALLEEQNRMLDSLVRMTVVVAGNTEPGGPPQRLDGSHARAARARVRARLW